MIPRSRAGLIRLMLALLGPAALAAPMRADETGPVDAAGRPQIVKLGTIDCDMVETTPVVFRGRVYRCEWVRPQYWANATKQPYSRLVDVATGEATAPFAHGYEFSSAFAEGDTVYVTATSTDRATIQLFASRDLRTWETWTVFHDPAYGLFNTSLCRDADGYVLMFEIDRPKDVAGVPFTARFLKSRDLRHWELTAPECRYAPDRYTAPHCLRFLDGWYYDFYLEVRGGYEMRVVRSRDLVHWEPSRLNPVLRASVEDRAIRNPRLSAAQREKIAAARDLNNSDIDFCEHDGRLVMFYSWGDQVGTEFLAEAEYRGTLEQFLRGWFPEPRALDQQLIAAAEQGEVARVQELLARGAQLGARDDRGRTALLAATHANQVGAAALLVAAGSDVNAMDLKQDSPYLYAGAEGRLEILKLTLASGADLTSTNRFGGTALIPACEKGHVENVKVLLQTKVDVNHVNNLGWTALMETVMKKGRGPKHTEIARLLLAAGANPNLPDKHGVTPLAHAIQAGNTELAELLRAAGGK